MHPRVACDDDSTERHHTANPFDSAYVPPNLNPTGAVPFDTKEIVQAALALAEEHRQGTNVIMAQSCHHVRRNNLSLQWNRRLVFESQSDHEQVWILAC